MSRKTIRWTIEAAAVAVSAVVFWVPLYFVFVNALKDPAGAAEFNIAWPAEVRLWDNIRAVIAARDYMLIRAFVNSTVMTVLSVTALVAVGSMAGFVLQRRSDRATPWILFFVMSGLIVPPAIVPTIWVLEGLGLFKTMTGIVLVEVALHFPFAVLLYRGFTAGIPREIDEAAIIDGYGKFGLFFRIIFPLLQPVTATIVVTASMFVFNDFMNPLYFFPGAKNATVQLTLYNFISQYISQWNLLFTNALLITLPPLVLFIFFNKKIIAGMTAGAVKG